MQYVVMVGELSDGFAAYGPFADADDASEHGEHEHSNSTWWVLPLNAPDPVVGEVVERLAGVRAPSDQDWDRG